LAGILRLYQLSAVPISLNPDELAIGYNSYSLLTTGKDEWGHVFPLSMKSFGDWKLPVYPVITMIPIAILGLNEFSVRLPSALAGIGSVLVLFFIAKKLFKSTDIGLICAGLFALSPWSIFFSRGAFEVNIALLFLLIGILLQFRYFEGKQLKYLISSVVLFGLTLFTYHAFDIFMPIFLIAFFMYFHKKYTKKAMIISILIFGVFSVLFGLSLFSGSLGKAGSLSVMNDPNTIYNRADKFKTDGAADNQIVQKVLYNKYSAAVYQVAENYLLTFSPTFLFDKGGVKLFYNISGFGFLYIVEAVFLLIGFAMLFWNREKYAAFLILWVLIAPIPLALTREVPAPTRSMNILPVLLLIEGYGAYYILSLIRSSSLIKKGVSLGVICIYLLNVLLFLDLYFVHTNQQNALFFHYGYKQVVELARKYPEKKVVMVGPDNFPYISFLFYEKYDPNKFRSEVTYYPANKEGLVLVKSFGRYSFVDHIDFEHLQKDTLYIDNGQGHTNGNLIRLPNGEPLFVYFTK
jgi:4-amino-4-deoxy-L-arabinose transferase-like glycosyltransferase